MRHKNQPVQTRRESQGWTTTKATSDNNNNKDHNDAGKL
jgi:hypothetical protein